jgi:hypothetical protein
MPYVLIAARASLEPSLYFLFTYKPYNLLCDYVNADTAINLRRRNKVAFNVDSEVVVVIG